MVLVPHTEGGVVGEAVLGMVGLTLVVVGTGGSTVVVILGVLVVVVVVDPAKLVHVYECLVLETLTSAPTASFLTIL